MHSIALQHTAPRLKPPAPLTHPMTPPLQNSGEKQVFQGDWPPLPAYRSIHRHGDRHTVKGDAVKQQLQAGTSGTQGVACWGNQHSGGRTGLHFIAR